MESLSNDTLKQFIKWLYKGLANVMVNSGLAK